MINVLQYGNNIKAWWDYNDLKSNGYYVVIINGKKQKRKQTFKCFVTISTIQKQNINVSYSSYVSSVT